MYVCVTGTKETIIDKAAKRQTVDRATICGRIRRSIPVIRPRNATICVLWHYIVQIRRFLRVFCIAQTIHFSSRKLIITHIKCIFRETKGEISRENVSLGSHSGKNLVILIRNLDLTNMFIKKWANQNFRNYQMSIFMINFFLLNLLKFPDNNSKFTKK